MKTNSRHWTGAFNGAHYDIHTREALLMESCPMPVDSPTSALNSAAKSRNRIARYPEGLRMVTAGQSDWEWDFLRWT